MKKILMVLILMLVGSVNAQTPEPTLQPVNIVNPIYAPSVIETTGWGINPEFSAPYMFGQDANGTLVSIPSFGVGADIGYKDYLTDTNGFKAIKYSAGFVANANISQAQPSGPKSVLNGLLGGELGYKGINIVFGNQLLGDTLTGPDGSRWLFYVGYDATALLGDWTPF